MTNQMKSKSIQYVHWFHGFNGVVNVEPIEGSSFCDEMECVNCAGRRTKEEEERYRQAKQVAFKKFMDDFVNTCEFEKKKGVAALSAVDDTLHYLTPDTRIKLTHFQPIEYTIESDRWTFATVDFLQKKTEMTKVLQQHCARGWFTLYVTEDYDGKVCCNVTVSKRRDL
jgi:hypothetical protein